MKLAEIQKQLPKRERREIPGHVEIREEGDAPTIDIFIPFNSRSVEMFGFTEVIAPGAFKRSIANGRKAKNGGDIKALWQHLSSDVLGRQANGTLDLRETRDGLEAEVIVAPNEIRWHADALASIKRGDVDGSSFGFEVVRQSWDESDPDNVVRTLEEVRLYEVSPVTFPAYPGSASESRSALDAVMVKHGIDTRELAKLLNEASGGKVAAESGPALRSWIERLTAYLPAPVVEEVKEEYQVDWQSRLALRERRLRALEAA